MIGLLHLICFWLVVGKQFLMELVILQSNEGIHEDMLMGVLRSPFSYFDVTPSGQLASNFSNDLGILDNNIVDNFLLGIDRAILWVVMSACIMRMNLIYLWPIVGCLIFSVAVFKYCKEAIMKARQLNLKLKSPVFTHLREIMRGLVPIQALQQTEKFTQKMVDLLDTSLRGAICMNMLDRFFAFSI